MTSEARRRIDEVKEKKLTTLDLGRCGLDSIPEEVFEMDWLEELILGNEVWDEETNKLVENNSGISNKIETIPPGISKLKKLEKLYIPGMRWSRFTGHEKD